MMESAYCNTEMTGLNLMMQQTRLTTRMGCMRIHYNRYKTISLYANHRENKRKLAEYDVLH
jgi:hypothetical protein